MMLEETEVARKPFERVASGLKSRILAGEWRPGMLLPGRRALAAEYDVAGSTLERAIAVLNAEGLISISDRRGTFVSELPDLDRPITRAVPPPAAGPRAGRDAQPLIGTIGIVAGVQSYSGPEESASQWPLQILHGCEHRLAGEAGLTMRFVNTHLAHDPDFASEEDVQQLLDAGAAAIILVGLRPSAAFTARFAGARAPLVFAEYDLCDHPFPQVYADDVAAGALAARHLLERGYRRLLYFQPFAADFVAERLAGVRSALGASADSAALRVLPAEAEALEHRHDQAGMARRRGREALDAGWEPGTGVIAPNDTSAVGFIHAARKRGLEPGRDYGIVGFDDRHRDYGLTSLRPPLRELGEEAAGLAIRLLRGEPAPARIALHHRLIARESTRGPRNGC